MQTLTFASSHALTRQNLQQHEPWIRARLGCPLEDMLVLRMPLVLTQLALSLLGSTRLAETRSDELARLADVLESAALPPGVPLSVELHERVGRRSAQTAERPHRWALTWQQCPVALRFRGLAADLIALRVIRFGQRFEPGESVDDLLLLRRDQSAEVLSFLEQLLSRKNLPELRVLG